MNIYTIGYGGRKPQEFIELLKANGIRSVVDVRLRPDRSSMGAYVKAKDPAKGIEGLLSSSGFLYFSFIELGNVFLEFDDWKGRYAALMDNSGNLLTERLSKVTVPFCLMCAEKDPNKCHRMIIAEYLAKKGCDVEHI